MELGTCSKDICFSTRVFELVFSKYLNGNCVDGVVFLIREIDDNFFETVIGVAIKSD